MDFGNSLKFTNDFNLYNHNTDTNTTIQISKKKVNVNLKPSQR